MHSSDQNPEQVTICFGSSNKGEIHLCLGEHLKKYFIEEGVFVLGLEGERSFLRAGRDGKVLWAIREWKTIAWKRVDFSRVSLWRVKLGPMIKIIRFQFHVKLFRQINIETLVHQKNFCSG